jgi:hypothetical protein
LLEPNEIISFVKKIISEYVDREMANCKDTYESAEDMPSPEPVGKLGHFIASTRKNCAPTSETQHMDDVAKKVTLAPSTNCQDAPCSFAPPTTSIGIISEPNGNCVGCPSIQRSRRPRKKNQPRIKKKKNSYGSSFAISNNHY